MTTLFYGHHGTLIDQEADSIYEAACCALSLLSFGDGYPEKITHDGETIWEERGPVGVSISLERLRDAAGLITRLAGAQIAKTSEEPFRFGTVLYDLGDGWTAGIFYDAGELDYIDIFTTPDGVTHDPWGWPDESEAYKLITSWRG